MSNTAKSTINRRKKLPSYRSFRLSKKITVDVLKPIPSTRKLWRETWQFLWKYRYKMLLFVTMYAFLYVILVRATDGFDADVQSVREELGELFTGNFGAIFSFVAIYGSLVTSITSVGDIANIFQTAILIVFSVAFIWLLRKLHSKEKEPTVKQAFYGGMGPLVPFIIVVGIMALQLVPAGLGSIIFSIAQANEIIAQSSEMFVITVLMVLMITLSAYLFAGSIFAPYIVTLPGTEPLVAIRSSMRLLRIHRWQIVIRILTLLLILLFAGFFVMVPFIVWLPRYAELIFFVVGSSTFAVIHTFLYKFYRSLL